MSWGGVLALVGITTATVPWWAAPPHPNWQATIFAGGFWLLILGGRFYLEWCDRYGWVGRLRSRLPGCPPPESSR